MKKIVLLLIAVFAIQSACFAQNNVSFIYINGSNNNNKKMRTWYENGVYKLHPILKKKLERNARIKKLMLDKGNLSIENEPKIFFWGDKSKRDLEFVNDRLDIGKAFSPSVAYHVREAIASYMHDAIWVQKPHHMKPILDELNELVKKENAQGNKVVLYGYSAGTFITYEYLFNKERYVNLDLLFKSLDVSDDMRQFIANNPRKDTCISALAKGRIGVVATDGHLYIDRNDDRLKTNYLKMNEATEETCAPTNTLKGIVNFASPLVLFYSDLSDTDYELTYYNKLMMKYIMENGLFWLTVNFREDPLGFPTTRNLTSEDMERLAEIKINEPKGFIYDNSSVWSRRAFLFAHTAYWNASGTFSKAIVKTFTDGYRFQYDKEYQKKIIKRNKKTSELL